jgi:hypothetical protein
MSDIKIKSYYYEEPNQEYVMNLGWAIEQDDENSNNTLYLEMKDKLGTKNWDTMYHKEKIDFMMSAMGANSQMAELMVGYYNWKYSKKKVTHVKAAFFDCEMEFMHAQYDIYSLKLNNQSTKRKSSKSNNNDDNFGGGFFAGRLWG